MRPVHTLWLLSLAAFAVFAGSVIWIEIGARSAAISRMEKHARNLSPALWNLDPRLASDYVSLAIESYGYAEMRVVSDGGGDFIVRRGAPLEGAEVWLDRLGLLPRIALSSPVVHEGRLLGAVHAVLISRTLYAEFYLLVAIALSVFICERSLRVIEGRRTLEKRVADRTRQLAESEARHRQLTRLLDLSPDVIFVREAGGGVTWWNEGAARVFGPAGPATLAARLAGWFETIQKGDRTSALAQHGLWSGEVDLTRPADGAARKFHASLSVTREKPDRPERVLVIATDITARKELELQLQRAQRAEVVGTLASGVAHDFNNLLTPILLSSQLLRAEAGATPAAAGILGTIEQCAQRGADLVRQLLNLSGHRPSHRSILHPPELLRDIARLIRSTFPKTISLGTDWPDHLPRIEADATSLHQAVLNLCVNARDAMPDGGTLTLRACPVQLNARQRASHPGSDAPEWIAISVQDSGTGIAAELHERIFEPFFTTKDPGQGTGLGLASVQGIAHNHGGFVEVDSAPGRGSTFTIYLPAQPDAPPSNGSGAVAAPPAGNGELLLIVDDEAAVLGLTARLLEAAGYRTCCARSGHDALELLDRHRHELRAVIMDLMMPGMDGLALRRRIGELLPGLPVAVMTGLLNAANRAQIEAAAFDVTLAKPYHSHDLLSCAARLLRPPA